MNRIDALAALLSDSSLRQAFMAEPASALAGFNLSDEDVQLLAAMDREQLEAQARALLTKRQREVAKFLPRTLSHLMSRHHALFADYAAERPWPEGHQRHHKDALAFLNWLKHRGHRVCLKEYWQVYTGLTPRRWLLDAGMLATRRGWRAGLVARIRLGKSYDVMVSLG